MKLVLIFSKLVIAISYIQAKVAYKDFLLNNLFDILDMEMICTNKEVILHD